MSAQQTPQEPVVLTKEQMADNFGISVLDFEQEIANAGRRPPLNRQQRRAMARASKKKGC